MQAGQYQIAVQGFKAAYPVTGNPRGVWVYAAPPSAATSTFSTLPSAVTAGWPLTVTMTVRDAHSNANAAARGVQLNMLGACAYLLAPRYVLTPST